MKQPKKTDLERNMVNGKTGHYWSMLVVAASAACSGGQSYDDGSDALSQSSEDAAPEEKSAPVENNTPSNLAAPTTPSFLQGVPLTSQRDDCSYVFEGTDDNCSGTWTCGPEQVVVVQFSKSVEGCPVEVTCGAIGEEFQQYPTRCSDDASEVCDLQNEASARLRCPPEYFFPKAD